MLAIFSPLQNGYSIFRPHKMKQKRCVNIIIAHFVLFLFDLVVFPSFVALYKCSKDFNIFRLFVIRMEESRFPLVGPSTTR